jgi:acyl-CoA synthetase (AMP-forming)/AMP-acid ligase II
MPEATTLLEILRQAPDNAIALILPEFGIRLTYQDLRDQVLRAAGALAEAGIRRGDRVAIVMPNGLPAIVAFLAASIVGTAAPLNPSYRQEEFSFFFNDTGARLLLCLPDDVVAARKAAEGQIPVLSLQMNQKGFVDISSASRAGRDVDPPNGDDVAIVLHTSGSTGRPKRVPIRHANLAASTQNIVRTYRLSPEDVSLCVMPLFHVHGLVASLLSTFLSGGTVVTPAKMDLASFWQTVRDSRVSWYSAVPTIHQMLLTGAGKERPSGADSLRFIRSCSASLAPVLTRSMEGLFAVPVLEAYGMTEAAHQMCSNPPPPGTRIPGSVGPGTGVQVCVMDEGGRQLNALERGEVAIRGRNVITGYENNPEANTASFTEGWFRTGDQGFLDVNAYLTLTGRIKELISRGGEKIGPREIDETLLGHPDVAEAVTFGLSHPTLGEEVAAAIVLRNPQKEAAILAYCRERLADFKCPKKLYVVKTIPRTATGKIQRGAVAAMVTGRRD